jgi:hypothetical protein
MSGYKDTFTKLDQMLFKISNRSYLSFWLRIFPTKTDTVRWPNQWPGHLRPDEVDILPNDPNDIYRPWLEKNVGKQHIAWDWEISGKDGDLLEVKFRKGKYKWATLFLLLHT